MNLHIPKYNNRRAFTLIELLVVIAIIAILAAISVPVGNSVMQRARKLQASAAMKGLEIAVKGYQTEYNRLPQNSTSMMTTDTDYSSGTVDAPGGGSPAMGIMDALVGVKTTTANPRMIKFYEPAAAKDGKNGWDTTTGLTDPWGKSYTFKLDYDGDGVLENPYKGSASGGTTEPDTISGSVIIWCAGPDMKAKSPAGRPDDVRSWQ